MERRSGLDGRTHPLIRQSPRNFQKTDFAFAYDSGFCGMFRAQNKRILRSQHGTTLIEVMIGMLVFLIIMLGGIQYFLLPQTTTARQKIKRLATSQAETRLEQLKSLNYALITAAFNETDTPVTLGSISGLRSTTISNIDDPEDGLGVSDSDGQTIDYKTIRVDISWVAGKQQTISMTSAVSFNNYIGLGNFSSWGRKCYLSIISSKVPGALTNFPVLLTEGNLPSEMFDADGSYPALNGGGDVRFSSDANGNNPLACEIVKFITDNDPLNGKAEIWVNVPAVSSTENTSFWVWYNKAGESQPAETAQYGAQSVWDSNYLMVQHMKEDPSTSAPQFIDVTANSHDGTNNGGLLNSDLITGKIGDCIKFDGATDDDINLNAWDVPGSQITVQHWVYINASPTVDCRFFSKAIGTALADHWIMTGIAQSGIKPRFRLKAGSTTTNLEMSSGIGSNNWYFFAATYDGSNMRIWLNNQNQISVAKTGTIAEDNTVQNYLGDNPTGSRQLSGRLDEVRISNIRRSDSWLETEYNNQNSPSTFVIDATPMTP